MEVSEIIARICQDVFTHPGPIAVIQTKTNTSSSNSNWSQMNINSSDSVLVELFLSCSD